ncbi:hypothetical protein JCM19231_152 [Vibrio ishigakensis]|uniref:Uncharacterized protein n=1 Tax=Vibrio ishigakensis TaxID=1481914 RepID=A0A0B8NZG2_9VIBR|nr:hypothetical protein [Vibrio ishigakensis]GAM59356.1 hypothetical protein JCM19231_152 [Vibrio ishigakensis]
MEKSQRITASFDYTDFLAHSSASPRWRFIDALQSIAPIFSTTWRHQLASESKQDKEQLLWESALVHLSSTNGDESNLSRLMKLARSQGIECLMLSLPYSFEPSQIEDIEVKGRVEIKVLDEEHWKVKIKAAH